MCGSSPPSLLPMHNQHSLAAALGVHAIEPAAVGTLQHYLGHLHGAMPRPPVTMSTTQNTSGMHVRCGPAHACSSAVLMPCSELQRLCPPVRGGSLTPVRCMHGVHHEPYSEFKLSASSCASSRSVRSPPSPPQGTRRKDPRACRFCVGGIKLHPNVKADGTRLQASNQQQGNGLASR